MWITRAGILFKIERQFSQILYLAYISFLTGQTQYVLSSDSYLYEQNSSDWQSIPCSLQLTQNITSQIEVLLSDRHEKFLQQSFVAALLSSLIIYFSFLIANFCKFLKEFPENISAINRWFLLQN